MIIEAVGSICMLNQQAGDLGQLLFQTEFKRGRASVVDEIQNYFPAEGALLKGGKFLVLFRPSTYLMSSAPIVKGKLLYSMSTDSNVDNIQKNFHRYNQNNV